MNGKATSMIITIIIAVLALAAGIFAIAKIGESRRDPDRTNVKFTDEEEVDLRNSAHRLVSQNLIVYNLFYLEQLPKVTEAYGNKPEDGYYSVDMTYNDFNLKLYTVLSNAPSQKDGDAEYSQIEEFVNNVYISNEANRILTNSDGTNLPVYIDRNGRLGVKDGHQTIALERKWNDKHTLIFNPKSKTECEIVLLFNGITAEQYENDEYQESDIVKSNLLKVNGRWKLEKFLA